MKPACAVYPEKQDGRWYVFDPATQQVLGENLTIKEAEAIWDKHLQSDPWYTTPLKTGMGIHTLMIRSDRRQFPDTWCRWILRLRLGWLARRVLPLDEPKCWMCQDTGWEEGFLVLEHGQTSIGNLLDFLPCSRCHPEERRRLTEAHDPDTCDFCVRAAATPWPVREPHDPDGEPF